MKKFPILDAGILEWVEQNSLVNSKFEPFEFDWHAYLMEPLCDWHQLICIRKSAQIGFSETFGILKALYAAKYLGWNVIYTNPTISNSDTFVTTKVNPIITNNPLLAKMVLADKLDLKQIGNRFIYFRGTKSTGSKDTRAESVSGISISSDLNIYDEHDRSDQFVIDQYASRLENSDYGGQWSFSNPTYPGVGVDGMWEKSSQKHWMVTCEHCGHRQYLDWIKLGENINYDSCVIDPIRELMLCSKCREIISDTARMRGEWVAKFPDREISGYWMSQLNYPKHSIASILKKEKERAPDNFYNFVLGKPYRAAEQSVDRQVLLRNVNREDPELSTGVALGVDVGIDKHYVLMTKNGIFQVGVTQKWEDIEKLITKYKATTVVDGMPQTNVSKKLANKFSNTYYAFYKEPKDKAHALEWQKGKLRGEVRINRTLAFDMVVDLIMNGNFPINMNEKLLDEFIAAWNTMYRAEREDNMGIKRPSWNSSNESVNHFAHATIYAWAAMQKLLGGTGSSAADFKGAKPEKGETIVSDENWTSALPSFEELVGHEFKKE